MTSPLGAYRSRLTSAEAAVALIPATAKVVMGLGVAQPPALLRVEPFVLFQDLDVSLQAGQRRSELV